MPLAKLLQKIHAENSVTIMSADVYQDQHVFCMPMVGLSGGMVTRQADICQLGMDQRKVNMLAREYCDEVKRKLKPIILSHPMLPGLQQVLLLLPAYLLVLQQI